MSKRRSRDRTPTAEARFLDGFAVLYDDIAARLRLEGVDPTQARVAKRLGLSNSTVSEWRRGRHRGISLVMVNRLAHETGLSVADLFSGNREMLKATLDQLHPLESVGPIPPGAAPTPQRSRGGKKGSRRASQ